MPKDKTTEIVICNIPDKLLNEFDKTVVAKHFPGGYNEAFRRLMADAVKDEEKGRFA